MTYGLLLEKEKKIKEGMKIMGMDNTSFYLSWILWYMLIYLVAAILITIILKTSIFEKVNFFFKNIIVFLKYSQIILYC